MCGAGGGGRCSSGAGSAAAEGSCGVDADAEALEVGVGSSEVELLGVSDGSVGSLASLVVISGTVVGVSAVRGFGSESVVLGGRPAVSSVLFPSGAEGGVPSFLCSESAAGSFGTSPCSV